MLTFPVTQRAVVIPLCQAHTILAAERYGADAEKIVNIWEYRSHPAFSEAERAALDFALQASTVPNGVDATIKARLLNHWNEGEVVEILGVISLFGFLNRWNDSMGTRLEQGAVDAGERLLAGDGWEGASTLRHQNGNNTYELTAGLSAVVQLQKTSASSSAHKYAKRKKCGILLSLASVLNVVTWLKKLAVAHGWRTVSN